MTNAEIIFMAEQELAKDGIIKYTGRTFKAVDGAGNEIEIPETEEIHTFNYWKDAGYMVQKGQHAVAKLQIWKHTGAKMEAVTTQDGEHTEYVDRGRMFMKVAAFFSRSQVQEIEAGA